MRPDHRNKAVTARPWRGWYSTAAWQSIRARRLAEEPNCRMCGTEGIRTPATIVDHITPHRGNRALFFDFANTQSLDARCHDQAKQGEERRGYSTKVDRDGLPTDPRHPFNKAT